jgi:hypothetical protein
MVVTAADWLYPSFLKGPQKINDEFRKVIYVELFGENCKN